ncbi:hypothetical protein FA13DRAFT_700768 [Coprinellus micaceus]|uniref:Uncharacterized protein n=1 Tax=Coprinellus micaceus TaxID=71717 RepID=A0A4Y7S894_COPMI|nr:hypothetical protein FA13DRAFT_700768 [Coprinellus micaceus]
MPQLILPAVDCGPTPTVSRPFPSRSASQSSNGGGGAFVFPLPGESPSASFGGGSNPFGSANGGSAGEDGEDNDAGDDGASGADAEEEMEKEERAALRLASLEVMVSLSEARPGMVKRVGGWVEVLVRGCLEGMGELEEEAGMGAGAGGEEWAREDVSTGFVGSPFPCVCLYSCILVRMNSFVFVRRRRVVRLDACVSVRRIRS